MKLHTFWHSRNRRSSECPKKKVLLLCLSLILLEFQMIRLPYFTANRLCRTVQNVSFPCSCWFQKRHWHLRLAWHETVFEPIFVPSRSVADHNEIKPDKLNEAQYEKLADATLDSLSEYLDHFFDNGVRVQLNNDFDLQYAMGVLTINLGRKLVSLDMWFWFQNVSGVVEGGKRTYVINKQTPNKQIWLSSPFSGPKRYDFCHGRWIYLHDMTCLHDLLNLEFRHVFKTDGVDFTVCVYGK